MTETIETTPLSNLINQRKEKVQVLRGQGIEPYPTTFDFDYTTETLHQKYGEIKTGEPVAEQVSVAGRIVSVREMGKSSFAHLQDNAGKVQIYVRENELSKEGYNFFLKMLDIGDFVGVSGKPFRTRTGELSIIVEKLVLLSKSLRPLPEKWHGLKDVETRYRQRYLDLISNPKSKETFVKRSRMVKFIRQYLDNKGFLEVETPMMQSVAGGATARPFVTHHNALDMNLYLRIAPELYLKRLVVGGYDKIYELNRNFRNEGISTRHNPEFTMLELYQAYTNYSGMCELAEDMITSLVETICGSTEIVYQEKKISFARPWKKVYLFEIAEEYTGKKFTPEMTREELLAIARELNIDVSPTAPEHKIFDHIFDEKVVPNLVNPTFVLDYPKAWSPLAKSKKDNSLLVERFELFISGEEVGNAYSELNDPIEQRARLEDQARKKTQGDEEAMTVDEDYVEALEYGMPPCGGLGIGIDRLVMILCDHNSIRETIAFPLLREEK